VPSVFFAPCSPAESIRPFFSRPGTVVGFASADPVAVAVQAVAADPAAAVAHPDGGDMILTRRSNNSKMPSSRRKKL
jgi:hypothetical protein